MSTIDTFVRIGHKHTVCEDAVTSYKILDRNCGALSDGCSSSDNTSFGSQLVLSLLPKYGAVRAYKQALAFLESHDIPVGCIDATLITLNDRGQDRRVTMYGDGVVYARSEEAEYVYVHEYLFNAPGYLSYEARDQVEEYLEHSNNAECTVSCYVRDAGSDTWRLSETVRHGFEPWVTDFDDRFTVVAIASDGLTSFMDANGRPIDTVQTIDHLFHFKNTTGQYLQRRCQRFFGQEMVKLGWKHHDDVSIVSWIKP